MTSIFSNEKTFANSVMGRITKSNLTITLIFYPLMIILFVIVGSKQENFSRFTAVIMFFGGLVIWTLLEYIFFRFISKINQTFPSLRKIHFLLHGIHHNNPKNRERMFIAPLPGLILSLLTFSFWFIFLRENAYTFMAGIISGYLFYACVHYAVHRRPGKLFSHRLWIHHLKHHHKYPDKAFGVSTPFWDFVFGTMPPKDEHSKRQFS